MKLIYVLVFVLGFCGSVSGQTNTEENRKKFAMLEWLTGEWKRTDMKPGRSGSEMWKKISDRELRGIGVTIKGNDTVAVERMRLIDADSALYFAADVPENKRIVYFRLLSVSDSGFICENSSHDFPKTIEYHTRKRGMRATISGDGRSVEYLFVRHP